MVGVDGREGVEKKVAKRVFSSMAGGASRLRRVARKIAIPCASFSEPVPGEDSGAGDLISSSNVSKQQAAAAQASDAESSCVAKNLCAICLEALNGPGPALAAGDSSPSQAVFTAQCGHSFHFLCIASNVRHGNVTCPICRAYWTQLPRSLLPTCSLPCPNSDDPILRILDHSIATSRFHRRSTLRTARYDDDDPVVPPSPDHPRLLFSLTPAARQSFLSVKLGHQRPTDLVLVTSANGPHLRLLKQSMALAVFSLRPVDRLAIVTYSSAATRAFPLRRMTSAGKKTAVQVIDRLFYLGEADPTEGLKKAAKILQERTYKNPHCCILHLSDSPTRHPHELPLPVQAHYFHVGFGFGTSTGFVMHEFEEFLGRLLGGVVGDVQVKVADDVPGAGSGGVVRLGELRSGEERRVVVENVDAGFVCVGYSYVEDGGCLRSGEVVVGVGEKVEQRGGGGGGEEVEMVGGRYSSAERWEYHDPYMARRWAKHLHGYRL